ncbi:hypothetical protein [Halohasta salina]|uniref:hypothetical protein n=1 Tax=Halohasta salina TaxID=2961621 RepID=UPI0020A2CA74|nr:hypothetical protein [Halohasta salina]
MVDVPNQAAVGIGLIIVGGLLFIPGATVGSSGLVLASLVVAALLLTAGTYLFGTSGSGRSV